jgi:hypothetical protein
LYGAKSLENTIYNLPFDALPLLLWIQARGAMSTGLGFAGNAFLISTASCLVSEEKKFP